MPALTLGKRSKEWKTKRCKWVPANIVYSRKRTLRDLMKRTASFNPFPRKISTEEVEAKIAAEDEFRHKYLEENQANKPQVMPKSLLRTVNTSNMLKPLPSAS